MRAATLRSRLAFQKQIAGGGDASWGSALEWVEFARVWGSVQAEAGTETAGDHAVMSSVTYTVRTRWLDGVTSQQRIVWNDRTLDILSVIDPTGRGRELEIKAVENVANG